MAQRKGNRGTVAILLVVGLFWLLSGAKKEGLIVLGLLFLVITLTLWWSRRSWSKSEKKASHKVVDTVTGSVSVGATSQAPRPASISMQPVQTISNEVRGASSPANSGPQNAPKAVMSSSIRSEDMASLEEELSQALNSIIRDRVRLAVSASSSARNDAPVQVQVSQPVQEFRIPRRPQVIADAKWIPPGGSFELGGRTITGGMVYVGTSLPAGYGSPDPCLIDKSLSLGAPLPLSIRSMGYWPSYSDINSSDRATYLEWLATGRSDPRADVGFVFLFFYGLERRVLIDGKTDPLVKAELPVIAKEVERLLSIYSISHSFQTYATSFLDVIRVEIGTERLYDKPVPDLPVLFELPLYIRIALGQASRDEVPLPVELAMSWLDYAPGYFKRTAARRCPDEYEKHFIETYRSVYGAGMKLPKNRSRLKLVYRPASAGFRDQREISKSFSDLPDVTAVTGPFDKLCELATQVTDDLDAFSRFMGKTPELREKAIHLLPFSLWPDNAKSGVLALKEQVASGYVNYTVRAFFDQLGMDAEGSKAELLSLHRVLDVNGIALEPDIDNGAKLPKANEHLVLFAKPDGGSSDSLAYRTAQLTLRLAATMVHADGEFSKEERDFLLAQIDTWKDLTSAERVRLGAHMELAALEPMSFAALKKKIEPLSLENRERLAEFMATLARMDGVVSPDEVKVLEKAYKALGIDADRVFSDLHATATTGRTAASDKTVGVRLDPTRVAALQKDSEKVSELLSSIFKEEETVKPQLPVEEPEPATGNGLLLGLDKQLTALAHLLLSRPVWTRQELTDAAADMDLMLDGALERINEAAFDAHGIPFFEGEDPLEINPELVETISA